MLQALAVAPLEPRAHILLGLLVTQLGHPEDAVRALERAIYLEPEAPLPHYYLADAYRQLGQADRASRAYRHVLRLVERLPPGTLVGEMAVELLARSCRCHLDGR